jgi:hypothetical protein
VFAALTSVISILKRKRELMGMRTEEGEGSLLSFVKEKGGKGLVPRVPRAVGYDKKFKAGEPYILYQL